ncbi:uncharacterized protein LDX57_010570 [Aspergillus melleus]|uniref:uncharacterized protein n=1 Tax=Aspergillus melleus TaxID=138277 RepID=UPI001E8EBAA7|nr:uncharacterized protein LDX57_010570 [Aspergillus melleus]KAH8432937.1 hypothetical protein LDX57_010570 [Aspergillus melleus]
MKGSDKSIANLARHEIIQSLTIWITKDAVSGEYPTMLHGQVAAIRIVTDRGQNVTFCPSIDPNFLDTCLKTQYQADPYQGLAAVSWVLNSRFDRVRTIFSPKTPEHIFAIKPELYAAFSQIQKLPFELILGDGCYDKLTKVVGHIDASAFRGFTFAYKSGQTWIIGDNHSHEVQSFEIPESDRIVGLSLRTAKGIQEISVTLPRQYPLTRSLC